MEQYCTHCDRSFAGNSLTCPQCGGAFVQRANGDSRNGHKTDATPLPGPLQTHATAERGAHSEHEIDLGSPVSAGQPGTGGPPSGASFVSWSAMLERKTQGQPSNSGAEPAVEFGTPTSAQVQSDQGRLLPSAPEPDSRANAAPQASLPDEGHEAEIDLGKPVTEATGDSGPLSGASGVGWAALLRARKKYEDPNNPTLDYHNPEPGGTPQGTGPQLASVEPPRESPVAPDRPPASAAPSGWHSPSLALGFLLGIALCGALWWLGVEPPQAWRLARPSAPPESPAVPDSPAPR
ncbi:MAG: hypothetical protein JNM56_29465 [Planctomycetia bacterium]|nr:hypothetical protein [Planctomycetia bacterium]